MLPNKKTIVGSVALSVTVSAILGALSGSAEAAPPKAKVYITQESIPRGLPEKDLIAFAKKNQASSVFETKGSDNQNRSWIFSLLIAFNASPGEMEYELVFYSAQKGVRIPVENRSMVLSGRDQKTYLQKIVLKQPKYQPDQDIELVVVINGQQVGGEKFHLGAAGLTGPTAGASDKPGAKPSK